MTTATATAPEVVELEMKVTPTGDLIPIQPVSGVARGVLISLALVAPFWIVIFAILARVLLG